MAPPVTIVQNGWKAPTSNRSVTNFERTYDTTLGHLILKKLMDIRGEFAEASVIRWLSSGFSCLAVRLKCMPPGRAQVVLNVFASPHFYQPSLFLGSATRS
jgi:hypothetical protein